MAASVWMSVIVLIYLKQVSGAFDADMESIMNCNKCIKSGGYWCNNPEQTRSRYQTHCSSTPHETCGDNADQDVFVDVTNGSRNQFERSITVGILHRVTINAPFDQINFKADTSRQFSVSKKLRCKNGDCVTSIESVPSKDFCSANEDVLLKIKVQNSVYTVHYKVSCTCECSKRVQEKSMFCNHHGNHSCGVCACDDEWVGENCEKNCEKRGDQSEEKCMSAASVLKCSGNGVCGACQSCECNRRGEGSQYYDPEYQCVDICTNINFYCDQCFQNLTLGPCVQECNYPFMMTRYNATLMDARNAYDEKIWMTCKDKIKDCDIEYAAMRAGNQISVMVVRSCQNIEGEKLVATSNNTVPWILGVLAAIVVLMAAAGYVFWKSRKPDEEMFNAEIQNFNAQDSAGRNPLYKPPTSFFKNPTYGKL